MSEAELHILKARMLEGRRAKARRGELGKPVPMGYVRRPSGEVALDPDEQAQSTIRQVFELFERYYRSVPVHSFPGLMAHLATYCRLTATTPLNQNYQFTLYTKATPTQEQAFKLLGIDPDRTQ